jgi:hypothetical protein
MVGERARSFVLQCKTNISSTPDFPQINSRPQHGRFASKRGGFVVE